MTHNQIDFVKYKEDQRHNQATETETNRHNLQDEKYNFGSLAEATRHNKASEGIGYSNVALGYANLGELNRHNLASESISASRTSAQNEVDRLNAATNAQNAKTNATNSTRNWILGLSGNINQSVANKNSADRNDIESRRVNNETVFGAARVATSIAPYLATLIP